MASELAGGLPTLRSKLLEGVHIPPPNERDTVARLSVFTSFRTFAVKSTNKYKEKIFRKVWVRQSAYGETNSLKHLTLTFLNIFLQLFPYPIFHLPDGTDTPPGQSREPSCIRKGKHTLEVY